MERSKLIKKSKLHLAGIKKIFPNLPDNIIENSWSGIVCRSGNSSQIFNEISERILKMDKKNITYLEADWTRKDPIISETLEQYGRTGLPLYLLFPSEGDPLILPEILTEDILLSYLNEVQ